MNDEFAVIADELRTLFESPDPDLSEAEFNALALRAFEFQFRSNSVYGGFCRGRSTTPESVSSWRDIPAVPTSAFKALPVFCGDPSEAEAVFRTSGTSLGPEGRGSHYVADLELYAASAISHFARYVLPDGVLPALVALVPDPAVMPDSSLSHMAGLVGRRLCRSSAFCAHPEHGVDVERVEAALSAAVADNRPVLLFGTAFAFVHWTDDAIATGRRFALPKGSRIMETGGFKGRSREVTRERLYETLAKITDVSMRRILNEYGMTEMLSQFYETALVKTPGALAERHHVGPAWVRTRLLDPVDLREVPDGDPGILAHFDLANLGSACAILTEDRGVRVGDGFRLMGRTPGSEPRGCSLSMEEFLRAEAGV